MKFTMSSSSEDVNKLFKEVLEEISQNIRHMMEELWLNWSHLGVDEDTKVHNIMKLILIEKELHRDVISETRVKLKVLQDQVKKLKEETEELSKCLSVDITILEKDETMMLADYKRQLEQRIEGYRRQVQERRMKIDRLQEWQRDLAEKLGVTIQELPEVPLPSEEELNKLKTHLELLQAERDKRAEVFLNTQIEVKDIMEKLQIKPQTKFEHMVVTSLSVDFKVTDLNMDRLAKLQQDLQERYEQTNNRVLELRERLTRLWECLEEDQIYRENFLQAHQGCHPLAEAAIKEEIKRCDQIKRQKIQVFIAKMRTNIKLSWDRVMFSQAEREQFVHYWQDVFTEDTLTLHEMHLSKLTAFYNDNKEIFDLVAERKKLWEKMTDLEARATEPGRYQNRGGQLLKEERERKVIATKLPKIEERLRSMVMEYEARNGRTFTVDGKPLLQLMADDWESRKAERHNKVSARKNALTPTPTPTTPLPRSLAVSPLGKRNRTAAGLAATPADRVPQKRPLITASATKVGTTVANNRSALKRSAISTVKRRISGRLVARSVADGKVRKRIHYDGERAGAGEGASEGGSKSAHKAKPTASGSILKHKRKSGGKRRSSSKTSMSLQSGTSTEQAASAEREQARKDPLMETTLLTTYTDFKDRINDQQISRSSMATAVPVKVNPATPQHTPKKTPRKQPLTPKTGKENIQYINVPNLTPKTNLMYTPNRLTRSALKLNYDNFATPRAPLSASKPNLQRQNTVTPLSVRTPPLNNRSKSQTHLVRAKNLPPLM